MIGERGRSERVPPQGSASPRPWIVEHNRDWRPPDKVAAMSPFLLPIGAMIGNSLKPSRESY
jgi:hypothetical protein